MREEDAAAVRAGFDALARRDLDALLELLSPRVELHTVAEGTYVGHEGIRMWLADMDTAYEQWSVRIDGEIDTGTHLVLDALLSGRSRINQIETSLQFWVVWEVVDGLPTIGRHFRDLASALKVAKAVAPPLRDRDRQG